MDKPKVYTQEDVKRIEEWFSNHELPDSIRLSKSTNILDLRRCVGGLLENARDNFDNTTFAGYIIRLEEIIHVIETGEEVD